MRLHRCKALQPEVIEAASGDGDKQADDIDPGERARLEASDATCAVFSA
jgi:hypothetical protein